MRGLSAPLLVAALTVASTSTASAQGIFLPGAGPINSSMAGASTAAPIDVGASYWNPATISGLERTEFMLASGVILSSTHLTTALDADSVSNTFPPTGLFGRARSNSGSPIAPVAAFAVRLTEDDPITYGLGLFTFYGGGVNFPGGTAASLLGPTNLPKAQGYGPIYSSLYGLLFAPIVSYRVNERLSLAFGPTAAVTTLDLNPFFFSPGTAAADGSIVFAQGTNGRAFWGGGFQVGMLYEANSKWNVGFSYKSPIWQERFNYNAAFPNGAPRRVGVQANIPEIFSWGVAYKGLPKTLIDVDFRYFDYANAALFGQPVTNDGAAWRSIFAVAVGGQYQATDRLTLRAGYLYNQNPIRDQFTYSSTELPAIISHTLSVGASYNVTDDVVFSAAYLHGFRNSISGPIAGLRGTSERIDLQTDSILLGFNIKFGAKLKKGPSGEDAPTGGSPRDWSPAPPQPAAASALGREAIGDPGLEESAFLRDLPPLPVPREVTDAKG